MVTVLGVDLTDFLPYIKILLLLIVLGNVAVLGLLKFYVIVSCGVCESREKMKGKTVIVTGATSGIGKETALDLARRGARVILACRNVKLAEATKDSIVAEVTNENVVVKQLDLSSQKSIREFAEEINRTEQRLDVLIHNAGTAENSTKVTEDGLELTMATNHFGPYLLTHLLIDLMKRSAPARIIVVASELYRLVPLDLEKINPLRAPIPLLNYYVSKHANILFTRELARRLEGSKVTANCLHPGMIDSGIWRNVPIPLSWGLLIIIKAFFKNPKQGSQTTLHLAVAQELEEVTGEYFMDCKPRGLSASASNEAKAKKFWELSEELAGLKETDAKI